MLVTYLFVNIYNTTHQQTECPGLLNLLQRYLRDLSQVIYQEHIFVFANILTDHGQL